MDSKTTLLKMLENWLISQKNVKPENIVFITFEDREIIGKKNSRAFLFFNRRVSFQLSNIYQERAKSVKEFILRGRNFSLPKEDIFSRDLEKVFEEYVIWGGYPEVIKTEDKETKKVILKKLNTTFQYWKKLL